MISFSLPSIAIDLIAATRFTLILSLAAFFGGALVGIILLLMRVSGVTLIEWLASGFMTVFQSTPLLMQMFLAFFGLALFGLNVPAWLAAGLALILWSAAFLADIWRGCVNSVPREQWEASASLAMSYLERMRYVILPQAVRIAIPQTIGFSVQIVKSTSIASIVGFVELSKASSDIMNVTFEPFRVYIMTAAIYFVICWVLTRISRRLEQKNNGTYRNR